VLDLYKTGVYLRCPGGGTENVAEQKAAGVSWALMNVGGDPCVQPAGAWDKQRRLYRQHGIPQGPWRHCRSLAAIATFIDLALTWNEGEPADALGLNVEDVVRDGLALADVAALVKARWTGPSGGAPVHMATLPWVQNGQGWHHVADFYAALELFPLEAPLYVKEWEACIQHAFDEGLERVTLLYSTTSPRTTYPAAVAHCLYTADNVTDWNEWTDTVPQIPPKEDTLPPTPPPKPWYEKPYPKGAAVGPAKLPRVLKPQEDNGGKVMSGPDALAFKRAISRAQRWQPWNPAAWDDDYWTTFARGRGTGNVGDSGVRGFQRQEWPNDASKQTGILNDATYQRIREARVPTGPNEGKPLLDAVAIRLLKQAAAEFAEIAMCHPIPAQYDASICQDLHPTAGLLGNWAIDFCVDGGTPVVAVEAGTIKQLSGNNPAEGSDDEVGIFGWSIHYETAKGYRYYTTHYGDRTVRVGQIVKAGDVIGHVGRWPGDAGRSHLHQGVTSPLGTADAKKRMEAVANSARVKL
jgi:Peptidase family M23